ncbi:MAG: DUF4493 domain-containing protein [Bacteroidales bacterium]|nr:DUF4493 domain-containing protein [Bacteroidales bacterium]
MKKTILFAAALVAMTACNKSVLTTSEAGYGWINLGVTADTEMVVTKAGEVTEYDSYYVKLTKVVDDSETNVWGDDITVFDNDWAKYSDVKGDADLWKVPAGNYKVYVKSHLDAAAYEGKGEVRVAGSVSETVVAGVSKDVTVTCEPVNSKVSFAYTPDFDTVFDSPSVSVVDGERTVEMVGLQLSETIKDHTTADVAYFAPKTLTWKLTATVNDSEKNYSKTFTTDKAKWSQITFTTGSTDGQMSLIISVNGEITEVIPVSVVIDPITDSVEQE